MARIFLGISAARRIRILSVFAIMALTSGCVLLNPFPSLPDDPRPGATLDDAVNYATKAQTNYKEWLKEQDSTNTWLGVGAIAMGGAALGLGTVGGSSAAIAALGTGGGALVAIDQWVVGSPSKDPKFKAYTAAIGQLQCVIDGARAATPIAPSSAKPGQTGATYSDVVAEMRDLSDLHDELHGAIQRLPSSECAGNATVSAARLRLAQATADLQRLEATAVALGRAPNDVIQAVHAIDFGAFTQAQNGLPDITSLPKVASVAGKPPTPSGPSPAAAPARKGEAAEQAARPVPKACPVQYIEPAVEALTAGMTRAEAMLSGISLPQAGFGECLGSAKTGSAPSSNVTAPGTLRSGPTAPTSAYQPISILPALELTAKPNQTLTISIAGGRQPLFLIPVDPGIEVSQKPGSTSANAISAELKVDATAPATHRVLVEDITGTQLVVSVNTVK